MKIPDGPLFFDRTSGVMVASLRAYHERRGSVGLSSDGIRSANPENPRRPTGYGVFCPCHLESASPHIEWLTFSYSSVNDTGVDQTNNACGDIGIRHWLFRLDSVCYDPHSILVSHGVVNNNTAANQHERGDAKSQYPSCLHCYDRTTAFTCRAGCKEHGVSENRQPARSSATLCSSKPLRGRLTSALPL